MKNMRAGIVIYLDPYDIGQDRAIPRLKLYDFIEELANRNHIPVTIKERPRLFRFATPAKIADHCRDGNLHIVDDGFQAAPNVLNAGLAYINHHWHLDPKGIRGFSSIADRPFRREQIRFGPAKRLFDHLRTHHIENRSSRYEQPDNTAPIPRDCIAVFFQGSAPLNRYKSTTFSDLDMLNAVIQGTENDSICVKFHPIDRKTDDLIALAEIRRQHKRVKLRDSNVHDILVRAKVVVTINSTAALEAFMHRKPVIHFGKTDLGEHSSVVTDPKDFPAALKHALASNGGYAKFLYWYLRQQCLWMHDNGLEDRIWTIFAQAGFPKSRFGIAEPVQAAE